MKVPAVRQGANKELRKQRIKARMSQAELASLMELGSAQSISNIEYGSNKFTLEKAFKAAAALNVNVNVFLYPKVTRIVYKKGANKESIKDGIN